MAKIRRVNGQETTQFDRTYDENCMIYGFDQPVHCLFDAGEEAFDEINAQVSAIAESNGLSVQTKLTAEAEFKENPIYVQHGWNCNCIDTGGDRCAEPRQYDSDGGDRPSEGVCSYAQHWHDTKVAAEADCL